MLRGRGFLKDGIEEADYLGRFAFGDRQIYGKVTLNGLQSTLRLWGFVPDIEGWPSWEDFHTEAIYGVLDDSTRVSLFHCQPSFSTDSSTARLLPGTPYSAELFFREAIFARRHLSQTDRAIDEISFLLGDADSLFLDLKAFGRSDVSRSTLLQILSDQEYSEEDIGPHPSVTYFAGKAEVFSASTSLGRIYGSRRIAQSLSLRKGFQDKNTTRVVIELDDEVCFQSALNRVIAVTDFFGLVAGRPQNLLAVDLLSSKEDPERPEIFEVYSCTARKYAREDDESDRVDTILDMGKDPIGSSEVISNWINRSSSWKDSRHQFYQNFGKEGDYDVDRLVGAANMFDLLPESVFPRKDELTEESKCVIDQCKDLLKSLPKDIDTRTAMSDLRRLRSGSYTLKQKIGFRVEIVLEHWDLPDLCKVTDEAVNCRNHFVHGTSSKIDYRGSGVIPFLTQALEFVFATSDLLEDGWMPVSWRLQNHPFGRFSLAYASNYLWLMSQKQKENSS